MTISVENVKSFLEKVRSDSGLQSRIGSLASDKPVDAKEDWFLDSLVAIGAESGFAFSREDLLQAANEIRHNAVSGELDDAQLESVSGGLDLFWHIVFSFAVFGCIAVEIVEWGEKLE